MPSILTALQGAAGNLGMYAMGFPLGLLTDARGPRLIALIGSICLAIGYYPIYLCRLSYLPANSYFTLTSDSLSTRRGFGPDHFPMLLRFYDRYWWLRSLFGSDQDRYVLTILWLYPYIAVVLKHQSLQLHLIFLTTAALRLRCHWPLLD
jgi:hypothetical protein